MNLCWTPSHGLWANSARKFKRIFFRTEHFLDVVFWGISCNGHHTVNCKICGTCWFLNATIRLHFASMPSERSESWKLVDFCLFFVLTSDSVRACHFCRQMGSTTWESELTNVETVWDATPNVHSIWFWYRNWPSYFFDRSKRTNVSKEKLRLWQISLGLGKYRRTSLRNGFVSVLQMRGAGAHLLHSVILRAPGVLIRRNHNRSKCSNSQLFV